MEENYLTQTKKFGGYVKRYLNIFIVLMMMLSIGSLMADTWTEDFESNPSTSYGDASVTISGRVWTKVQAGNFSYGNTIAGSYGFVINDDSAGAHITTPALNTIETVSFKYAYINGSDTNVFVLQKSYDNENFIDLDTHTLGASANQNYVDYSYDINDSATEIYIRVLSDAQNAHLSIDDFSVTDYSGGTTPTALSADFSADYVTGLAPLTVNFTPAVTGGTSPYGYAWDFDNNGSVDSTEENPAYDYTSAGTYSVKLTVTDAVLGTDIEEKINYITVTEETSGSGDELMTNGSLEAWDTATSPTGWDKKESIEQEATIVHSGSYSAKQTAGTKDLGQYVEGIVGGETYTISYWFLDNDANAKGRIYSYWREGTSTLSDNALELRPSGYSTDSADWQQVSHTLTAPATADNFYFEVRTYNDNSGGGVIYYDDFSVMGAGGTSPEILTVDFEADVLTGQVPLTVNFTNLVTGGTSPYLYSWDFDGDNNEDSDAANPSFTYYAVGTYPVKLYVMDSGTSDGTEYKSAYITVTTSGGSSYYSGITATEGAALKSQLKTLISTNTNTSYDGARAAMYSNIDNINNTVTCVYTGLEVSHSYGDTSAPTDINCEHSYAQSWIEDYDTQNEELRAKADVHHLFPTDSGVNSSRGNLSFDVVNSVEYSYSYATGYVSYRGDNDEFVTVFEPTDQHKGDLARALLYMNVRYDLPLAPPVPNNGPINVNMLPILLEWHGQDPVDAAEITRNNEIEDYQGNRNPFVDYPEWVNAIYGGEPVFTCATPTMNPAGGTFDAVQNVTLATTTADADIYYTTNGDTPTSASTLYSGAIEVAADMTIKAIAVKAGWNDSQMASESYVINIIPTVSIYDIQYVADPTTSDASAYQGQTVNVTGIVTAVNSSGFNISAPAGGAWNGILVYNNTANPTIGDEVTFNGQVVEYNTLTELSNINGFQTLSQGNSVTPAVITTAQASTEAYEGVLVTVENVSVTQEPSTYNEWYVTDGSGNAQIDDEYGYIPDPAPSVGQVYSSITGIVDYKYGSFGISPRDADDVILDVTANQLPVISDVTHAPLTIYPTDAVTVTANAVDNDGTIATINLKWGTETGVYTTTTAMTPARASYTADIPAQLAETTVYYVIEATDDDNATSTSQEASYTVSPEAGDIPTGMIISEYIEGGSNNKTIEIYNGTGADVDLTPYSVKLGSNGGDWGNNYDMTGTLTAGDVFVISNSGSVAAILAVTDATSNVCYFNGDDAIGLFYNTTLIDVIGVPGVDPGSSWDVAGGVGTTVNYTLVRKVEVTQGTTDWAVSAGTDETSSQWNVYPQDTFTYLGSHGVDPAQIVATPEISPVAGSYDNQVEVTITCATEGATIYYTIDGNDPTTASDVYSAPFTLTADATVKAFASLVDYDDSAIASADYTIVDLNEMPVGMIISEYIEGSGSNKVIEIYNGTGAEVDLTPYTIKTAFNGGDWGTTYDFNGTLAAEAVFVIANSGAEAAVLALADATSGVCNFNGDDTVALCYNDIAIDMIGVFGSDPGSSWDVAGGAGTTADYTLVRKLTVTEGTTDWALSAGTDEASSQWNIYPQDTFAYLGSYGVEPTPTVATPEFTPAAGSYNDQVVVTITCATDGATIYYTLDGSDPTTGSLVYSSDLTITEDTTVKAFATLVDYDDSAIATAEYTITSITATEVADIASLRAGATDGTIYRLTGQAILTYQRDSRNQKYIQDATAGILIDDNSGLITTTYNQYDGITNIEGTLNEYNGILQFVPTADPGSATSTGNTVTPLVVSITDITSAIDTYESRLVKLESVNFSSAGTFAANTNYTLTDGTDNLTFRTSFSEADYIGQAIFTSGLDVVAYVAEYNGSPQIVARNLADFTELAGPSTVATPEIAPATGTYYESQEVTITCATDGATIYYTIDGNDPTTGSSEYTTPFTVDATTTVKAMAVKTDWLDSSIAESVITIEEIIVPTGMIISEYIEGSSNNKAVEIYNGTGADVDLTPYTVRLASNGGDWGNTSDMQGTLASGDVYVIANASADASILAIADETSNVTYFNGDDAVGLFYNGILIDVFGTPTVDPGSTWEVAGDTGATANHTLVRKMTVTQGTTDWTASAGTSPEDSQWIVYPSDTFSYLGSHTEPMEVVASPVISPNGGNFENPIDVTLTCETAGASIYYTTNGDTPTDASTLYSAPFSLSADATIQAIAMKEGYLNSPVVSADFTFSAVTEVATIADLRAGLTDGTIYRLTGEAILTYQRTSRNQKYIQDATAGILIDDNSGVITTTYNLYDGITNLEGSLTEYNGTLQFVPSVNSDPATSTGNTVTPIVVTIADLNTNFNAYESQVVTVQGVTFVETGTFASGQNYTLTDGTNNLVFRTNFSEADYIGSDISANNLNVTGLAIEYQGTSQLTSRFASEIQEVTGYEDGLNISKTAMTFETEVGVESASQSYVLYMQGVDLGLVEVTGDFQIQDPDGAWGSDFFFELQEEEVTINVKFNATNAGTVYGQITHSADGFDDVIIDLTGIANEVLPTPIYDIQYTTEAGDGTYPSPYDGQDVLVEGIVTATNYAGSRYFISAPQGGAWNGIYVYDSTNSPSLGDIVSFRATVDEYYGWTELKTVTDFQVVSQGNTLPEPLVVTTADLASNEAYEGVLVKIENLTVTTAANSNDEWFVTDGSGDAQIDNGIFELIPAASVNDTFTSITGVVDYSYNQYGLNPRDADDIIAGGGVTELATPVITSIVKEATGIVITWEEVTNANSYKVYGSMNPDSGFELIQTVGTNSYTNDGADNMKFFKIEASTDAFTPAK